VRQPGAVGNPTDHGSKTFDVVWIELSPNNPGRDVLTDFPKLRFATIAYKSSLECTLKA
jgi:hypothetical protein